MGRPGKIREARKSSETEAVLVPLMLFFLMFMMVMMGAIPAPELETQEEKTQRIAEVLLGCLKPFNSWPEKSSARSGDFPDRGRGVSDGRSDLPRLLGLSAFIPLHVIPWFFVFLGLECVMVGSYLAALGIRPADNRKDAQNLMFPAFDPGLLPMFLAMPILQEPTSTFAVAGVPVPVIHAASDAAPESGFRWEFPAWESWSGWPGSFFSRVLPSGSGGRIFRIGILMQGRPPKPCEISAGRFDGDETKMKRWIAAQFLLSRRSP